MLAVPQAFNGMFDMVGPFGEHSDGVNILIPYKFLQGGVRLATAIGFHQCFFPLGPQVAHSFYDAVGMFMPLE